MNAVADTPLTGNGREKGKKVSLVAFVGGHEAKLG
jgi:hypothetical protein